MSNTGRSFNLYIVHVLSPPPTKNKQQTTAKVESPKEFMVRNSKGVQPVQVLGAHVRKMAGKCASPARVSTAWRESTRIIIVANASFISQPWQCRSLFNPRPPLLSFSARAFFYCVYMSQCISTFVRSYIGRSVRGAVGSQRVRKSLGKLRRVIVCMLYFI